MRPENRPDSAHRMEVLPSVHIPVCQYPLLHLAVQRSVVVLLKQLVKLTPTGIAGGTHLFAVHVGLKRTSGPQGSAGAHSRLVELPVYPSLQVAVQFWCVSVAAHCVKLTEQDPAGRQSGHAGQSRSAHVLGWHVGAGPDSEPSVLHNLVLKSRAP